MTNNIPTNEGFVLGGVRIYQEQCKTIHTPDKAKGETKYVINFKNGTTISYPEQSNAKVGEIYSDSTLHTDITGLFGAEFTGRKTPYKKDEPERLNDNVFLLNCKDCKVDVSNDNLKDTVSVWSTDGNCGNNQVTGDEQDDITFGKQPCGAGTFFEQDPKKRAWDKYLNPYSER